MTWPTEDLPSPCGYGRAFWPSVTGETCGVCSARDADECDDPEPVVDGRRAAAAWEWKRLHDANPGEAVYLASVGADPRHPTAGDQLAQLRRDRRPQ